MLTIELKNFVSNNPQSISDDTTLEKLLIRLHARGFHHLPVVINENELVGILSAQDVIRTVEELRVTTMTLSGQTIDSLTVRESVARDIMCYHMVTVDKHSCPKQGLELMIEQQINCLPIIHNKSISRMLNSTDFVREYSVGGFPSCDQLISDYTHTNIPQIEVEATLDEALSVIMNAKTDSLVVLQDDCPLAAISRRQVRDAHCRQAAGEFLGVGVDDESRSSLAGLANQTPILSPGKCLGDAAMMMIQFGVQAIAVINQSQRLFGVISEADILRVMAKDWN